MLNTKGTKKQYRLQCYNDKNCDILTTYNSTNRLKLSLFLKKCIDDRKSKNKTNKNTKPIQIKKPIV